MSLYQRLAQLKAGTEDLNYGRHIIIKWTTEYLATLDNPSVLDIGLGSGDDLLGIQQASGRPLQLYGLDFYLPSVDRAQAAGIKATAHNIECDPYPYPDASMDIVMANQVLEHTKEIFFILAEAARILKPGGMLVIGVPNLAAWHNRLLLTLGMQPSCIGVIGPHVRGFTRQGLQSAIELGNDLQVVKTAGSGFYPLPRACAQTAAKLFPQFAVGLFACAIRTQQPPAYANTFSKMVFETRYEIPPLAH